MAKVIQVAPRQELLSLDAVYGLAAFLHTLPVSRRKVLDWLAEVIFAWIEDGGIILDGEGKEIVIYPDTVDDAHGKDASVKTVSEMRARITNPPKRRPRKSLLTRLQLYDAAARVRTGRSIVEFGKEERKKFQPTRCSDCGRLIQPWPKEDERFCPTCVNPKRIV